MSRIFPTLQAESISVSKLLEEAGVSYALIGGLAVLLRGHERSTFDIDYLIRVEQFDLFEAILKQRGYQVFSRSNIAAHFEQIDKPRIDVMLARHALGRRMIEDASGEVFGGETIRVVRVEDLIGLKLQALFNDQSRVRDWSDIRALLRSQAENCDRARIREYFEIFEFLPQWEQLQHDNP